MAIAWTPEMTTGNRWLDREHLRLVARIDELLEAVQSDRPAGAVEVAMRRLGDAALGYFSSEAECALRDACSSAQAAGPARAALIALLASFRQGYERHGPSEEVVARLQTDLVAWVGEHIPGPCADGLPCVRPGS
ncbi:MAG TPA: hypothetical protein VF763_03880 [Candidatus Limnocylindrales bacterium]